MSALATAAGMHDFLSKQAANYSRLDPETRAASLSDLAQCYPDHVAVIRQIMAGEVPAGEIGRLAGAEAKVAADNREFWAGYWAKVAAQRARWREQKRRQRARRRAA